MGPTLRVLSRVVREFAAGVDAGNAIRLGLPVRGDALRDNLCDGHAGSATSAGPAQPAAASARRGRDHAYPVEAAAATTVASGRGRTATSRARA